MKKLKIGTVYNIKLFILLLNIIGVFNVVSQSLGRDLGVESGDTLIDRLYYNRYHSNNTKYLVWLLVLIPVFICIPCLIWVWCSDHCFQMLKYRSNMKAIKEKKLLNEIIMSSLNDNIMNKEFSSSIGSVPSTVSTNVESRVPSLSHIPPIHAQTHPPQHSSPHYQHVPYQQPSPGIHKTMEMSFTPPNTTVASHPTYIQSSPSYIPGYHPHHLAQPVTSIIDDNYVNKRPFNCGASASPLFEDDIGTTHCECNNHNSNVIYNEGCSCNRVDIPL
ncbi:signal peptide transmembrane domain near N-terminus [Cryptosporidium xiaoi]|uniref:Signal peptide transmembrane domain near N-terminus n=1 Tax=Cryptosporidium xiaoi TaxID=659607 RepID=A0AAV9XUF1_9CRYT